MTPLGGAETRYTLSRRVVPGLAPERATRLLTRALMRLDLPTLDRPTRAMTGSPPAGTSPPAALRFWDGELREDLNHWYDIFLSIAEKLYAEQRLKIGDLPLTLGRRTSYCIHTEPVGPNAQRFQAFRSIAEGKLLVNTHGSAKSMRNLSGNLLEHYDLTPADVQVLIRTPTHSPAATA